MTPIILDGEMQSIKETAINANGPNAINAEGSTLIISSDGPIAYILDTKSEMA